RLRQVLQDGSFHILHFVGHSDFVGGEGVLLLEDDQGGRAYVSASQLVNLLGDQSTLRLVVLNSCEDARTDADDPCAGLANPFVVAAAAVLALAGALGAVVLIGGDDGGNQAGSETTTPATPASALTTVVNGGTTAPNSATTASTSATVSAGDLFDPISIDTPL